MRETRITRFQGTFATDLASVVKDSLTSKQSQTDLMTAAIRGISGIAPTVDMSNPDQNVIHLTNAHGEFLDRLLFGGKKSPPGAPGAPAKPASVKLDFLPAAGPIAFKRVLPVAAGLLLTGVLLGRYVFPRR